MATMTSVGNESYTHYKLPLLSLPMTNVNPELQSLTDITNSILLRCQSKQPNLKTLDQDVTLQTGSVKDFVSRTLYEMNFTTVYNFDF